MIPQKTRSMNSLVKAKNSSDQSRSVWSLLTLGAAFLLTAAGIVIRVSVWDRHLPYRDIFQPILGIVAALSAVLLIRKSNIQLHLKEHPVMAAKLLGVGGCVLAYLYYRSPYWTPLVSEPWLCALCFVPASLLIMYEFHGQRRRLYVYTAEYIAMLTVSLFFGAYAAALMEAVAYLVTALFLIHREYRNDYTPGPFPDPDSGTSRVRLYVILLIAALISIALLALICGADLTADLFRWVITGKSGFPGLHGYDAPAREIIAGATMFDGSEVDITEPFYDGFPFSMPYQGYMITQVIYAYGWLPAVLLIALLLLVVVGCGMMLRNQKKRLDYISLSLYLCFTTEIVLYIVKDMGFKIANVAYLPFVSADITESTLVWLFILVVLF